MVDFFGFDAEGRYACQSGQPENIFWLSIETIHALQYSSI